MDKPDSLRAGCQETQLGLRMPTLQSNCMKMVSMKSSLPSMVSGSVLMARQLKLRLSNMLLGTWLVVSVEILMMNRQHIIKRSESPLKHVVMEEGQRICISKRQVKVCPSSSSPAEIVGEELTFFCKAKDQVAYELKALAESGERIVEAERYPISFTSTVHVPRRC